MAQQLTGEILKAWESNARNGWTPPPAFVVDLIYEVRRLRDENEDLRMEINEYENRVDPDPVIHHNRTFTGHDY